MRSAIILTVLSLAVTVLTDGASPGDEICVRDGHGSREPTVSREEIEILRQAAALAADDPDGAIRMLDEKIGEESSAALDFALGGFYLQKESPQDAEAAYRRALAKFPAFDRARANLARILLKQDRTEEALRELKEVLLAGTAAPSTLTMIGYISLMRDEPVAAETAYRQAILIDPDDRNASAGLVKALLSQGRYRESASLLDDLLAVDPLRSEFWFLLANARLALDEPERAITALECARRLGAASEESLATLADLYLNAGNLDLALERYREAFSGGQPSIDRMLRAAGAFLLMGDPIRAGDLLAMAEKEESRLSGDQARRLARLKARKMYLEGDLDGAVRIFREILDRDPLDGEVLLALGDIYRDRGEPIEAEIFFEQASRLADHRLDALIRLARLEVERERYGRAVELLEKAQSIRPQTHVGRYLEQVRRLALLQE